MTPARLVFGVSRGRSVPVDFTKHKLKRILFGRFKLKLEQKITYSWFPLVWLEVERNSDHFDHSDHSDAHP